MPFTKAAVTLVAVTRLPSILKLSEGPEVVGAGVELPVLGADGEVLLPPHAPAITARAIPARPLIILFMFELSASIAKKRRRFAAVACQTPVAAPAPTKSA